MAKDERSQQNFRLRKEDRAELLRLAGLEQGAKGGLEKVTFQSQMDEAVADFIKKKQAAYGNPPAVTPPSPARSKSDVGGSC